MTKFTVPLFVAIPLALGVGVGSVLWTDNSRIVFLLALVGVWVVWLMSDDGLHFQASDIQARKRSSPRESATRLLFGGC